MNGPLAFGGKADFLIGNDKEPELHFSSKLDLIKQSFSINLNDSTREPKLTIEFDKVNSYCLGKKDVSMESRIRDRDPQGLLSFTIIDCLAFRGKAHFFIGYDVEPKVYFSSKLDLIEQSFSLYLNDSTREPKLTIEFDKVNSYCLGKKDVSMESKIQDRGPRGLLSFTIIDCLAFRGKAHFLIGNDVEPNVHFSSKLDLKEQFISIYLNNSGGEMIDFEGKIDNQDITG